MRNVALDLGLKKTCFCEVRGGAVVGRRTVRSLDELEDLIGPGTPEAAIAIEACREAWVVHAQLQRWGHHPVLVDTTRVRRIGVGEHGRKTDRIDAEKLARALERGELPLAHVLSSSRQMLRHELAVRGALVQTRSQYIATVRGIGRATGTKLPSCEARYFGQRVSAARLPDATRTIVEPLLAAIATIDGQLVQVEQRLEAACTNEPVIQQLATTPGVAKIVAATFVSVIDDAARFRKAHQVESYLGLVPSEDTTGGRRPLGSISKHGNSYARAALVEAAWCIYRLRADDPLKLWARAVGRRRGNRVAITALARRLAGVLWAMWRDRTVYEPARVALACAGGLRAAAQSTELQAAALQRAAQKIRRQARGAQAAARKAIQPRTKEHVTSV
jgi:transposase